MSGGGKPQQPQQLQRRTEGLLRRLVRRDAGGAVRKVIARTRPEDVAAVMEHLTWAEQRRLYEKIDDRDYAAEVLAHLSDEATRRIANTMDKAGLVDLIERMEPDDATDIVDVLPEDLRARVLAELDDEDERTEVRNLLEWPSESAGGIMSPLAFTMSHQATCGEAIDKLRADAREPRDRLPLSRRRLWATGRGHYDP